MSSPEILYAVAGRIATTLIGLTLANPSGSGLASCRMARH